MTDAHYKNLRVLIKKLKAKMWAEEKEMAPKIEGHNWANGYSCACNDFRTCIIDELFEEIKEENKKEKKKNE